MPPPLQRHDGFAGPHRKCREHGRPPPPPHILSRPSLPPSTAVRALGSVSPFPRRYSAIPKCPRYHVAAGTFGGSLVLFPQYAEEKEEEEEEKDGAAPAKKKKKTKRYMADLFDGTAWVQIPIQSKSGSAGVVPDGIIAVRHAIMSSWWWCPR